MAEFRDFNPFLVAECRAYVKGGERDAYLMACDYGSLDARSAD